jgi:outer membrane protein OmpA-like peptidoglycan-associated protein
MAVRFMLLVVGLLGVVSLSAQRASTLRKDADKAFDAKNWEAALSQYDQFQQAQPGDLNVLTRIGICHFELHHGDKAREYLSYVYGRTPDKGTPDLYYYYARTLHGQSAFKKAAEVYKQFLRVTDTKHPWRAHVRDNIRRCLSGDALQANETIALVENLGDQVNSAGDEFAPLPSVNYPNRLYYSAARPDCQGGKRNDLGYEDEANGHWCSDIFFTDRKPAGWVHGGTLSALSNSPRHEVALDFGMNGQILYYFRGFTLYGGEILADTASSKDEYALQPPAFNGPLRGEEGDRSMFFFDNRTLLFASDRPGGYGGQDLWISFFTDSLWSEPQNLGPVINSPYDETTPFLARDGRTLFFSSNRLESMGGLDVFRAVYDDAKIDWQAPENYGPPVNSPGDDAGFRLSADGLTAWLASDRLDSYGQRDLYAVYYLSAQTAQLAPSDPPLYTDVAARAAEASNQPRDFVLPALYYTDDNDLLSAENRAALEIARQALQAFPGSKLLLSVHTDGAVPVKFDLYYGIKKAEILGEVLIKAGIPAERVVLRSSGSYFPASRTVVGAEPYPAGAALNRRAELRVAAPGESLPGSVRLERRAAPEAVRTGRERSYDEWTTGLSYGVSFVTTRQVLQSDALDALDVVQIESVPGSGMYNYYAGYTKTYTEAVRLAEELRRAGFTDAVVVAMVDGVRIGKPEAVRLIKKFPELAGYVRS